MGSVAKSVAASVAHRVGSRVFAPEVPDLISGQAAWLDTRNAPRYSIFGGFSNQIAGWASRTTGADAIPNVIWSQTSTGGQPIYDPVVAVLNNMPALRFDGTNDTLDSSPASNWSFLHSGTGASIFTVEWMDSTGLATQTVAATMTGTAANRGIFPLFGTANVSMRIANGSGTFVQSWTNATASHYARNVARWRGWSYATGTQRSRVSGSSLSNADTGGAPSALDPTLGLRFGGVGGVWLKGYLAQAIIFKRVLTDAEWALLAAWANSIYGVAV